MGMFNLLGEHEHRVFNYKPIYYDPEEEKRKQMFGAVDGSLDKKKEKGEYVPGSYIKGSFRDGNFERTKSHTTKVQTIIGIVTAILICVVLVFVAKFYAEL